MTTAQLRDLAEHEAALQRFGGKQPKPERNDVGHKNKPPRKYKTPGSCSRPALVCIGEHRYQCSNCNAVYVYREFAHRQRVIRLDVYGNMCQSL